MGIHDHDHDRDGRMSYGTRNSGDGNGDWTHALLTTQEIAPAEAICMSLVSGGGVASSDSV